MSAPNPRRSRPGDAVIRQALAILEGRMRKPGAALRCPGDVKAFLRLRLAELPREIFGCLFLDAQNRVIRFEEIAWGTVTQAAVFPREAAKAALGCNAAGCILVHNHPSGDPEPSHADDYLTVGLKQALDLVDVRTLDHFIVGSEAVLSYAEQNRAPFQTAEPRAPAKAKKGAALRAPPSRGRKPRVAACNGPDYTRA